MDAYGQQRGPGSLGAACRPLSGVAGGGGDTVPSVVLAGIDSNGTDGSCVCVRARVL